MRPLLAVAAFVSSAVLAAACALFYDLGTKGYSVSGEGGAGLEDCGADATCPALSLGCVSAENCDAGMICCLIIGGQSSAQSKCSVGPCAGLLPVQLCKASEECSEGGTCISQTCTLAGNSVGLEACGQLPQPLCSR
jgi:hypothetical protein